MAVPGLLWLALAVLRARGGPVEIGSFAPAVTQSAEMENLTAITFEEKVVKPVNATGLSSYMALVLFHHEKNPWPQGFDAFRGAKKRLENSVRVRDITLYRTVRFFMVDCTNQGELCERYTDFYPRINCFRSGYMLPFRRSWHEDSLTYWVGRAVRPAFMMVDSYEQWLTQKSQPIPCFILVSEVVDTELIAIWEELAMEFIEFRNFHVAWDGDSWFGFPGPRPFVHVVGSKDLNLSPAPFELVKDKELIRAWIAISSVPVLGNLNWYYSWELVPQDWTVVALRHYDNETAVNAFKQRAEVLRATLRYTFCAMDISTEGGNDFARWHFPLLAHHWEDWIPFADLPPRVFVFRKTSRDVIYWESLSFPSLEDFELEDVEFLIANTKAYDQGELATYQQIFMRYMRYGTHSWLHRVFWVLVPLTFIYGFLGLVYMIAWLRLFVRLVIEGLRGTPDGAPSSGPEKAKKLKKGKKAR